MASHPPRSVHSEHDERRPSFGPSPLRAHTFENERAAGLSSDPALMAIMAQLQGIASSQASLSAEVGTLGTRVTQVEANEQVLQPMLGAAAPARQFSMNQAYDHRRSTFLGASDRQLQRGSVPKPLSDGSSIKSTFNNGTSESVEEFVQNFEREVRRTTFGPEYFVPLAMKQLGATVLGTVEDEGNRREKGRFAIETPDGSFADCPAGWCLWDEFKEYLLKRYHHPHYEILALEKLLFGFKQTTGLDKYIELFNRKLAAIAGLTLSDQVKRVVLLHHMRPKTREKLMVNTKLLAMPFAEFCEVAALEDDSLYRSSLLSNPKVKNQSKSDADSEAARAAESAQDKARNRQVAALAKDEPPPPSPFSGPLKTKPYDHCSRTHCPYCKGAHWMAECPRLWEKEFPQFRRDGTADSRYKPKPPAIQAHADAMRNSSEVAACSVVTAAPAKEAEVAATESGSDDDDDDDECDYHDCDDFAIHSDDDEDDCDSQFSDSQGSQTPLNEEEIDDIRRLKVNMDSQVSALRSSVLYSSSDLSPGTQNVMERKLALFGSGSSSSPAAMSASPPARITGTETGGHVGPDHGDGGAAAGLVSAPAPHSTSKVIPTPTHAIVINDIKRSASKEKQFRRALRVKHRSDGKILLANCLIRDLPCRVLIDGGAGCNAVGQDFFENHKRVFEPVTHPTKDRITGVGGHFVDSGFELLDCVLQMGEYEESLDFGMIQMAGAYDVILGAKWLSQNRTVLDYDEDAEECVQIKKVPGAKGARFLSICSTQRVLSGKSPPKVKGKIGPRVIQIAALDRPSDRPMPEPEGEPQHRGKIELEICSHKTFKKYAYEADKQLSNKRNVSEHGDTPRKFGFGKAAIVACMLTVATAASQISVEPASTAVQATTTFINALVVAVTGVAAVAVQAGQVQGAYAIAAQLHDKRGLIHRTAGETVTGSVCNPHLPASEEMIRLAKKTRPECEERLAKFLAMDHPCQRPLPHRSLAKRTPEQMMSIPFKPGFEHVVPPPVRYKTPVHLQPVLKKCLTELINLGIIAPSDSPFCNPCMCIVKPHQEGVPMCDLAYRVVVDMRSINELTIPTHHRIPDVQKIYATLSKAKYITVLDLTKGFHQELIRDDGSREKTAFSTEWGVFHFVATCMGCRNTPSFFQSRVEESLSKDGLLNVGLLRVEGGKVIETPGRACVCPYIDDLAIYSDTEDEHFEDLARVYKCLSANDYHIQPPKCHYCCKYAVFCSAIVGNGCIAMDPAKIEAINNWQVPSTPTELRSFLGVCNYLKPWFQNYSDLTAPLTDLLKKGNSVKTGWGDLQERNFRLLKAGFMKYPVLRLPDFEKQFFIVTDSCDHAIGGAVMQMYSHEGKDILLPVGYHSRTMSGAERNYPVREQECLAIHDTLKKYEYLLVGSPFTIIIRTDHSTLKQVQLGGELKNKRLARWQEFFGGFDYKIEWIPGVTNLIGDGISRSLHDTDPPKPVSQLEPLYEHVLGDPSKLKVRPSINANMTKMRDPRLYDLKYDGSKEFGAIYSQLSSDNTSIDVHPRTRYFTIRRDQLFYRHADGSLALCVPEGHFVKDEKGNETIPLREALVRECHDSPYMGHRGANKTYLQVRRLFYWKGLPNYVNRYVASCKTCQRAKASTRGRMGALHPNEIPSAPMHSITMDFISGLPLVDGMTQVLVIVDRFSKFVWVIPFAATATAMDVARGLHKHVFQPHSWPLEIISDRDTKFTSALYRNLMEIIGTKLTFGFAHHQRFDGQTEVVNRVIEEVLRTRVDYSQLNWLSLLPDTVEALNSSVSTEHGMTPKEVYFGRRMFHPVDIQFGIDHVAFPDVKEFLEHVVVRRDVALQGLRAALVRFTAISNENCPLLSIDSRLKVGAQVMLSAKHVVQPGHHERKSHSLRPKKVGPFTIVSRAGRSGFNLDMPGYPHHKGFHASLLTPFSEELEFKSRDPMGPDHETDGTEFYEVEKLAARTTKYRKVVYFVQYKGYPVEDGEWMSRKILMQDCPQLVVEFDEQLRKRERQNDAAKAAPRARRAARRAKGKARTPTRSSTTTSTPLATANADGTGQRRSSRLRSAAGPRPDE